MAGIKDVLSKGITTINVKTDNFMEQTKSKTHINTLQTECETLYGKIGQEVFLRWQAEGEVSVAAVEPLLQQIRQNMLEIEQEKTKIESLQKAEEEILGKKNATAPVAGNQIFCSQCGAPNSQEYRFCCSCGQPLVK